MTHFEHLRHRIPDLTKRRILDIGASRGSFLLEAAKAGASAVGIEPNPAYIEIANQRSKEEGVPISIVEGVGEDLPFPDSSFDFVNLSQVIEHVDEPVPVLEEIARVLSPGGVAYMGVPARYSFKDPHFHVYFVNWMPRTWGHWFIGLLGKHKAYTPEAGKQRIDEMHYYTYSAFRKLLSTLGLSARDIREERIKSEVFFLLQPLALLLYRQVLRPFHYDSAHLIAEKPNDYAYVSGSAHLESTK